MRNTSLKLGLVLGLAALGGLAPATLATGVSSGVGPVLASLGPLAFGPDGMLYAGDPQAAAIFAIDLTNTTGTAGAKDLDGIDQKIAAMLGTVAGEITIVDLAVHPKSHNAYLAVMRGRGADAKPALMRVDGAGALALVSLDNAKFSQVALPNPPEAAPASGRSNRTQSITDLAFIDGRVFVAGLSNEEFASKLWSVPYPFTAANRGTSVEIFHGAHGALETRSPVNTFMAYRINGAPHIIASYTCTPLVKFPLGSLAAGAKVMGTTIAELGAGNRPLDMIAYTKDGKSYLLMSNNRRGVMKIPTADFGTAAAITEPVKTEKAGIAYETIASMTNVEQLDLLDAQRSLVITRVDGRLDLRVVVLP